MKRSKERRHIADIPEDSEFLKKVSMDWIKDDQTAYRVRARVWRIAQKMEQQEAASRIVQENCDDATRLLVNTPTLNGVLFTQSNHPLAKPFVAALKDD